MSTPSLSLMEQTKDMVVDQVSSLQLQFPQNPTGTPLPIKVGKKFLPRREQNQDPITQIVIWRSDQPEKIKYVGFGGKQWITFLIYVTFLIPGNQDLVSNSDLLSLWRQQVRALFEPNGPNAAKILSNPVFGITNLFEVRVIPDVWMPRQQLSIQYNYFAEGLQFRAQGA